MVEKKFSEELRHCLECDGCKDCESWNPEIKVTCKGLLQKAYEVVKRHEEMFPCEVGDTVYVLAECENIPTQLDGTLYGENGEPGTATGYYCPYEDNCPFDDEEFEGCEECKGKTAVFEDTVLFIACYENEVCVVTEKCAAHSSIGEYIFLTKPEAEQKLRQLENKGSD